MQARSNAYRFKFKNVPKEQGKRNDKGGTVQKKADVTEAVLQYYRDAIVQAKHILVQTFRKTGEESDHLAKTAELCCAIYEGNLLLYRIFRDPDFAVNRDGTAHDSVSCLRRPEKN